MEINLSQIALQIVNFSLLVFILTKFLYRPVIKLLQDRTKKIAAGLKAAETNLEEKNRIAELKQRELIKAEREAAVILEAARKKASDVGKDIVTEAKTAAQQEVKKEYVLLEEKIHAERKNLQAEISRLVIDTTRSILTDTLTSGQQQAIVDSQISQLKKLKVKS
ncbi:MAG: F0F1 ATP synthase subunit B [Candidatus Chisholmbacteria bacterium]|nr:F0F1 ATP synthase subunit B [Candidatus Chisholmbacteria bacterium]